MQRITSRQNPLVAHCRAVAHGDAADLLLLDGGHLVFYVIEAIRRKPLGQQAQEWSFRIGFIVVIFIMLVGNVNDLMRALFGNLAY